MRLRNEALDYCETGRTGKDSVTRLELADFQLNGILFRLANVRWIRNDEVNRLGGESVQQISFVKFDARGEFKARCVGARDFQRLRRNIRGMDFRSGKFLR